MINLALFRGPTPCRRTSIKMTRGDYLSPALLSPRLPSQSHLYAGDYLSQRLGTDGKHVIPRSRRCPHNVGRICAPVRPKAPPSQSRLSDDDVADVLLVQDPADPDGIKQHSYASPRARMHRAWEQSTSMESTALREGPPTVLNDQREARHHWVKVS